VPSVPPAPRDPSLVPNEVTLSLDKEGGGPGAFDDPRYIATDTKGMVYVADKTNRVQRFDTSGTLVSTFRPETTNQPHGPASDDIGTVQGLAVDARGRAWVSIGYDLVAYDASTGKTLLKVPHRYPHTCYRDITIDQTGQMFVVSACTDPNVYAIVKFDANGHTLATFPESADWEVDTSDRIAIDAAGNLYEPHMTQGQIVVVDAHARPVNRWGGSGETLGFFRRGYAPRGLAIDGSARLFASNGDDVDMYDLQGHPKGRLERHWKRTRDLAIAPDGQLWILHWGGAVRVRVE
jgi:sugar lactone lactonase YvrE